MNGWEEIDALVVSADAVEAQLVEISENLFRNELSALDRGIFVVKFREIYEEKHGKIDRTANLKVGQKSPKSNDWTSVFAPGKVRQAAQSFRCQRRSRDNSCHGIR